MKIIQKDKTHFILELELELELDSYSEIEILFNSIIQTNLLSFAFINKNQLHFHADSVLSFKEYKNLYKDTKSNTHLDIDLAILLFCSIGKQIYCLEQMDYTLTGFGHDFNDIIVINNCYFFYLNILYLMPFYKDTNKYTNKDKDTIYFLHPFEKPYFSSPELLNISILPAVISIKSIYYSLGCLIIYIILDVFILKGNDVISDIELNKILKPIYGTKLYWALLRCLKVDRTLLYV